MIRVLFFGTFDPLHAGHKRAFQDARALGDHLTVVVTRDTAIYEQKQRPPYQGESERLATVAAQPSVDEAILGDETPSSYTLLKNIPCNVLALGYDQSVSVDEVKSLLESCGKGFVRIVRLNAFEPHLYKSSIIRSS